MRKPDESDCFVIDGSVEVSPNDSSHLVSDSSALMDANHMLEIEVSRRLKSHAGIEFNDLVVRRCHDGLCVEGVVFARADIATIKEIMQDLNTLGVVHNRLTIHRKDPIPVLDTYTVVEGVTTVSLPVSAKHSPHAGMNALNRFFGKK